MSIYQPTLLSGLTGTAAGLLSNVVGSAVSVASGKATDVISGKIDGALGKTVASSLAGAAINMAANEVNKRATGALNRIGQELDNAFNGGVESLVDALGISGFANQRHAERELHYAGNFSMRDIEETIDLTNADYLNRKNFYVIQINDYSFSKLTGDGDNHKSLFNLFASNLSFNPFEINSNTVEIGAGMMNVPQTNGLTEMTLSLYDTRDGIVKEWAKQRQLLLTPPDGTVTPPYYHCFDVRVIYGTNKAYKEYYDETYTMRIAGIQTELDRSTSNELELVQLRFSQESTFMPFGL